jgi:hypothetical protein
MMRLLDESVQKCLMNFYFLCEIHEFRLRHKLIIIIIIIGCIVISSNSSNTSSSSSSSSSSIPAAYDRPTDFSKSLAYDRP